MGFTFDWFCRVRWVVVIWFVFGCVVCLFDLGWFYFGIVCWVLILLVLRYLGCVDCLYLLLVCCHYSGLFTLISCYVINVGIVNCCLGGCVTVLLVFGLFSFCVGYYFVCWVDGGLFGFGFACEFAAYYVCCCLCVDVNLLLWCVCLVIVTVDNCFVLMFTFCYCRLGIVCCLFVTCCGLLCLNRLFILFNSVVTIVFNLCIVGGFSLFWFTVCFGGFCSCVCGLVVGCAVFW